MKASNLRPTWTNLSELEHKNEIKANRRAVGAFIVAIISIVVAAIAESSGLTVLNDVCVGVITISLFIAIRRAVTVWQDND
jgi:anaerobic C4-dicarboxylate transporter